jgi:hypothetical protein
MQKTEKFFKGAVSRDFLLLVFFVNHLPQASDNSIRVISSFFKIPGDICKSRCTTGINYHGGKFATGINNTGGKFANNTSSVIDTGGK